MWLLTVAWAVPHMHEHGGGGTDVDTIVAELAEVASRCDLTAEEVPPTAASFPSSYAVAHHVAAQWTPVEGLPPTLAAARVAVSAACLESEVHGFEVGSSTWQPLELAGPLPTVDSELAGQRLGIALGASLDRPTLMDALASWETLFAALPPDLSKHLQGLDAAGWTRALSDEDGDGLVALHERQLGTDPTVRADADGWWDGAPTERANLQPLPLDETFWCFDTRPAPDTLGRLAIWRRDGSGAVRQISDQDTATGLVRAPSLPGEVPTLAMWARLTGDELVANGTCVSTATITVRFAKSSRSVFKLAGDDDETRARARAMASPINAESDRLMSRFVEHLGPSPARVYLQFIQGDTGIARTAANWPRVELDARVARPMMTRQVTQIAGLAIAMHYVGLSGNARMSRLEPAVALWTAMSTDKVPPSLFGADAAEVKRWSKAAEACATGWAGLLDRSCKMR